MAAYDPYYSEASDYYHAMPYAVTMVFLREHEVTDFGVTRDDPKSVMQLTGKNGRSVFRTPYVHYWVIAANARRTLFSIYPRRRDYVTPF